MQMQKSDEKGAALLLETGSGSAFFFSKGEFKRVPHFEKRANARKKPIQ